MSTFMRPRSAVSRLLFLLFNTAVLGIAWIGIVEPTLAWFETQHSAIDDKRDLLDGYGRALARGTGEPIAVPDDFFLPGTSDARRSAALQDTIKRIGERSGARILSVSGISASKERSGVVGVRVDMSGPLKAIAETVAGIESSTPALAIGRAAIRASAVKDEAPGQLTALEAQVDVYGFAAP